MVYCNRECKPGILKVKKRVFDLYSLEVKLFYQEDFAMYIKLMYIIGILILVSLEVNNDVQKMTADLSEIKSLDGMRHF